MKKKQASKQNAHSKGDEKLATLLGKVGDFEPLEGINSFFLFSICTEKQKEKRNDQKIIVFWVM